MSRKRGVLAVEVSRQVLWIGSGAYPVHNITRAQTYEISTRPGTAVRRWAVAVALWLTLAVAAAVALDRYNEQADPSEVAPVQPQAAYLVALVLIAISTARLGWAWMQRPVYALVIETAGSSGIALATHDRAKVTDIVDAVMNAIDNPETRLQVQVENLHVGNRYDQKFGDRIHVSGSGNVVKGAS